MKIVSVPGVNGLGKTNGCKDSLCAFDLEFDKIELNGGNIVEQLKQISDDSKKYFDFSEKVLFFGGDHSISYPLVNNFFERYGRDSKLIVFDAHPDLMEAMPEPGHEEWLRALVKDGFNPKNVLIVGVRRNSKNIDKKEIDFALKKGIKIIYSDEFDSCRGEILEFVEEGNVYCSIDIDVFDSSLVSCTTYPEEDGLSLENVVDLLSAINSGISFFDLVEINFEKGNEEEKEKTLDVMGEVLKTIGAK